MRHAESIRSIRNQRNLKTRSWDIVFEWEDIIADKLKLNIIDKKNSYIELFLQKIKLYHFLYKYLNSNRLSIDFVTNISIQKGHFSSSNSIPIVIDFWYDRESEIKGFIEHFKYVPLLFVTNKEVQKLLESYNCPFPVEHFPLSLPDKYELKDSTMIQKEYEFGFVGRVDSFFLKHVEQYAAKHEDFEYVYSKGISVEREYWTNKGKYIGKDEGRASYIDFLRKTKISCYSTPGMDEIKKVKYNQVTPRVLEMLANGCQVIGHYPLTEDVEWYDLPSVVPNVNDYEEFERQMDIMRNKPFDYKSVTEFLSKHYTSTSVNVLSNALSKHNLL